MVCGLMVCGLWFDGLWACGLWFVVCGLCKKILKKDANGANDANSYEVR